MTRQSGVWFNQLLGMVVALVVSVAAAWSLPPTQDLKGSVMSAKGLPIAAALCTLKGVGLPSEGIGVTTSERGGFDFPGLEPGQYDLVCVAVGLLAGKPECPQSNFGGPDAFANRLAGTGKASAEHRGS